jgi:hypothetical protein
MAGICLGVHFRLVTDCGWLLVHSKYEVMCSNVMKLLLFLVLGSRSERLVQRELKFFILDKSVKFV